MANKEFKIQSDTVSLNGVPLSSSTDGKVVIPGVTRATGYRVEEVNDNGDQTLMFETPPHIIDYATHYTWTTTDGANGNTFAEYLAELDGEGYIDKIEVITSGAYNIALRNMNEGNDMFIYSASEPDPFSPFFDPSAWTQIPFRPKMKSTGVESEFSGGGGSGSVTQREITFPGGTAGDTAGTIALNSAGETYICTANYVAQETVSDSQGIVTNQVYSIGQSIQRDFVWTITTQDYPTILALFTAAGYGGSGSFFYPNPEYFTVASNDLADPSTRTCTVVGTNTGGEIFFEVARTDTVNDPTGLAQGSEAEVAWTVPAGAQPAIWQQLDNGPFQVDRYGDLWVNDSNLDIYTQGTDSQHYAEVWLRENNEVRITADGSTNKWRFKAGGDLVFPDGSIQTTAYTGQGSGNGGGFNWITELDTSVADQPYRVVGVSSTQYDNSGNMVVTAHVYDATNGENNPSPTYTTVTKLSSLGSVIWQTKFDSMYNVDGWGVAIGQNNQVFVSGSTNIDTHQGCWILELSETNGAPNWAFGIDSMNTTYGTVVECGPDGHPVVVGYTNAESTNSLLTVKFDSQNAGEILWQKALTPDGTDWSAAQNNWGMGVGPDNEVVVISSAVPGQGGSQSVLIAKYNSAGVLQWQKTYQRDSHGDNGADADIDSAGNIYVLDSSYDGTNANVSTMKLSTNGDVLWSRTILGDCFTGAASIVTDDTNVYITATTARWAGVVNDSPLTATTMIGAYSATGSILWQGILEHATSNVYPSGNTFDGINGSQIDIHGEYLSIAGWKWDWSNGNNAPWIEGTQRGWVAQIDKTGTDFAVGLWTLIPGALTDTDTTNSVNLTTSIFVDNTPAYTTKPVTPGGNPDRLVATTYSVAGHSNELVNGDHHFTLNNDGTVTFPDGTVQPTAYVPPVPSSWVMLVGDGYNSSPHYEDDNSSDVWFDVVCAGPDGTVFCGGGWYGSSSPLVYQFDRDGKLLWSWMDQQSGYNGSVSAMAYNTATSRLYVTVPSGIPGRTNSGTRIIAFIPTTNPSANFADRWYVDGSTTLEMYDTDDNGYLEIRDIIARGDSWAAVGTKSGTLDDVSLGVSAATGTTATVLKIDKTALSQHNSRWPENNSGWYIVSSDNILHNTINGELGVFYIDSNNYITSGQGVNASFSIHIDYNNNGYTVNLNSAGNAFATGDTVTILGSKLGGTDVTNDLTFSVEVYPTYDWIWTISNTAGTAYTDQFTFDYGYYNGIDFTTPGLTFDFKFNTDNDPFINSYWDEFVKVQKGPNYGDYYSVAWNEAQGAYYAAGRASNNTGDDGLVTQILASGAIGWSKTGLSRAVTVTTDNANRVFVTGNPDGMALFCLNAVTGDKIWESTFNSNDWYNDRKVRLEYHNGFLYAAGLYYVNGVNYTGMMIEKIDPATGLSVWARFIHNPNDNLDVNYDHTGKFMTVTNDGVYIVSDNYYKTDNYQTTVLIKIPLDGGVSYEILDNLPGDLDSTFGVYGSYDGTDFSTYRQVSSYYALADRTDLTWATTDITIAETNWTNAFGNFRTNLTSLVSGEKATGVEVKETVPGWNDNNDYTLQISDSGKFIRSDWDNNYQINVYVPRDAEVNFEIGTVITLVNMWAWNSNSNYLHIKSNQDNNGNYVRVYLASLDDNWSVSWGLRGRGTATLMKVGPDEWLLTGANIDNTD